MFPNFYSQNSSNKELQTPKTKEFYGPTSKSSKDEEDSSSSLEFIMTSTSEKYDFYQSIRSTNISTLSKYENGPYNQTGAAEMIGILLNSSKNRRIGWVFYHLQVFTQSFDKIVNEKYKILEEVNELRYEKISLLEDNNSLRTHNEALISQLEKTNQDCYLLSALLNEMKINRMANNLSKLVENTLVNTFFMIR